MKCKRLNIVFKKHSHFRAFGPPALAPASRGHYAFYKEIIARKKGHEAPRDEPHGHRKLLPFQVWLLLLYFLSPSLKTIIIP